MEREKGLEYPGTMGGKQAGWKLSKMGPSCYCRVGKLQRGNWTGSETGWSGVGVRSCLKSLRELAVLYLIPAEGVSP